MTIIGTVGHIDHGKTALLRALTGIDADRLPEEQRRGITIDVGYAHLLMPGGRALGFVDLPGHHALAGNFLVGAGEMDAALLVVAADAGPEAQTFEHLDVLTAMGIRRGLVAVTKVDLADGSRRASVLREVATLVEGSALDGAPIIPVSALTGAGIDRLRAALDEVDVAVGSTGDGRAGPARLAVDRAFRVAGHGLVATGSLRGGTLAVGADLRVVPGDARVRVRRIQVHGEDRPSAGPGTRVAVNVKGRETAGIRRGTVLTTAHGVRASDRVLVAIDRSVAASGGARLHVALHIGTDHVPGILSPFGAPAETDGPLASHALLVLDRPVAVAIGDRFVLRVPSPPRLLGGGTVLDPAPPPLRRRTLWDRLRSAPAEPLLATLLGYRRAMLFAELAESAAMLHIELTDAADASPGATGAGVLALAPGVGDRLIAGAVARTREAGARGVPASALRQSLANALMDLGGIVRADASLGASVLVEEMATKGVIDVRGDLVVDATAPGAREKLSAAEEQLVRALDTVHPPALSDAARAASYPAEALAALFASGRLVPVAPDLAFGADAYRRLETLALAMAERGELSAAAYRDAAGTSRRHAVAVLEALALAGVLRRDGNRHELGPQAHRRLTRSGTAATAHGGPR